MITLGRCSGDGSDYDVVVGCCVGTNLGGGSYIFSTLVSGNGGIFVDCGSAVLKMSDSRRSAVF